jgi:hypothetical protein
MTPDRQSRATGAEDEDLDQRLAAGPEQPHRCMCEGVAREQDCLEEHHRRDPDGGSPAEQREKHTGRHRLDQEDEGCPVKVAATNAASRAFSGRLRESRPARTPCCAPPPPPSLAS